MLANLPDFVATVVGDLDYALTYQVQFDTLYQPGNEIVERWAGGDFVSNLDMLRNVLLTHDRVWIVISGNVAKLSPSGRTCSTPPKPNTNGGAVGSSYGSETLGRSP